MSNRNPTHTHTGVLQLLCLIRRLVGGTVGGATLGITWDHQTLAVSEITRGTTFPLLRFIRVSTFWAPAGAETMNPFESINRISICISFDHKWIMFLKKNAPKIYRFQFLKFEYVLIVLVFSDIFCCENNLTTCFDHFLGIIYFFFWHFMDQGNNGQSNW